MFSIDVEVFMEFLPIMIVAAIVIIAMKVLKAGIKLTVSAVAVATVVYLVMQMFA